TTKSPGRGTGLGLSVAWGIVDRHNGVIEVQSSPSSGATFRIKFDHARLDVPAAGRNSDRVSLVGVRVLLVEDDPTVLGGLKGILSAMGASVNTATSAHEACEWLEQNGLSCDVVVTDQGMAGATGIELLSRVRTRWPHVRRVLLSGWGEALRDWPDASAADLILGKPVRGDALAEALSVMVAPSARAS
ncbi:MAG TPA: response regulator, partial [Chthonomonadales bacterium]|nr:response regulator [Chthonomonadales bacterium]